MDTNIVYLEQFWFDFNSIVKEIIYSNGCKTALYTCIQVIG